MSDEIAGWIKENNVLTWQDDEGHVWFGCTLIPIKEEIDMYSKELHEKLRKETEQEAPFSGTRVNTIDLLDEIERLQSENKWIPVEDRLPEKEGLYCVIGKYVDGHVKVFSCYFKGNAYQNHGGYIWETSVKEITHWQPLPQAPEVKS